MKIRKVNQYRIRLMLLLQVVLITHVSTATNLYVPVIKNSVKTTIPLIGVTETEAAQLNTSNSLITTEYSDGLGQPNISVQKSITPSATPSLRKDLVTVTNYDDYGQMCNQWLPTPMSATTIPDPNATMIQAASTYADNMPYTTISRSTDMTSVSFCSPGAAWHNGNKVKIQKQSGFNAPTQQLDIRQYGVEGDAVVLYDDQVEEFMANITQTTDEDGHIAYTFTDIWGHTLLQRKIDNGVNFDTYYVYDDMGNLRFMLSPEASDRMTAVGTYSLVGINTPNNPLAQYGYAYKYDAKGHCIAKKLPGKDWTKMMYDMAGHLIFTQDGNQYTANVNHNQWTYYKYDALDRLIQSGTTNINDVAATQTFYNSATAVETYNAGTGYTSSNTNLVSNTVLLTQNFYDSYDYQNIPAYASLKSTIAYVSAPTGFDAKYTPADNPEIATLGMLTGTSIAMLDNSTTLVTAMYYDDRGRVVQTNANNHLNGSDCDYFHYNFAGQVVNKCHIHKTIYITAPLVENYRCFYDFAGRLTSIRHKMNTQAEICLDSLQYDELGRVNKKILHGGIQTINYAYNIHNQLKSIGSEKFNETLYYQDKLNGLQASYYNGNISGMQFGVGNEKSYYFNYDNLDRLKFAYNTSDRLFNEEVGSYDKNGNILRTNRTGYVYAPDGRTIVQGRIDDLTLDYNGNQLKKVSDVIAQSSVITTNDFRDVVNTQNPTAAEYLYDANGNQTADLNKGIAWIKYNVLNLPQKVQFRNGTKNEYLYDATGVKHRAGYNYSTNTSLIPLGDTDPLKENTATSTFQTDYCGNYVYEKSGTGTPKLKRVITPEGYVQTYAGLISYIGYWNYVYNLKDHLGNTRVALTSSYLMTPTSKSYVASDQIDYYPFGMERSNTGQTSGGCFNSGTDPYLYSGKEIDRMNGLNESDFSARWQDAAVPGFTTSDPLVENHPWESPYSYCGANPVNRTDPTGLDWYLERHSLTGDYTFFPGISSPTHTVGTSVFDWVGATIFEKVGEGLDLDIYDFYDANGNITTQLSTHERPSTATTSSNDAGLAMAYLWQNQSNGAPGIAEERDGGGGNGSNNSSAQNYGTIKSVVNISASAAFGGGVAAEFGYVTTSKNYAQYYLSVSSIVGLGATLNAGIGAIIPRNGQIPTTNNWRGGSVNGSFAINDILGAQVSTNDSYTAISGTIGVGAVWSKRVSGGGGYTFLLGSPIDMNPKATNYIYPWQFSY
jgi:RHS repeat-associated protein